MNLADCNANTSHHTTHDHDLFLETLSWIMPGEKLIQTCKYLALLH